MAMTLCLVMALFTPETVDRDAAMASPRRFALRPCAGALFGWASALGFFSFALLGLVSSLGAIILRSSLDISSHLIAGIAPFAMFAAVAQLVLGRLRTELMTIVGAITFSTGLGLTALSLYEPVLWLFLLAVSVAGAGAGALFKSGIARAGESAMDTSRAGVLAVYFVAGYVGIGLPSILFSVVVTRVAIGPAMIGFSLTLSAGALIAVTLLHRAEARRDLHPAE
ncbi:hypothetical protein [Streptomyces kronopolitis]|uniref:hypothetical protein n=1 Tax=Streptomyces kronopolitis TaxID=1612435 RepID=UPI00369B29CF